MPRANTRFLAVVVLEIEQVLTRRVGVGKHSPCPSFSAVVAFSIPPQISTESRICSSATA
jgi:hypothetical protein